MAGCEGFGFRFKTRRWVVKEFVPWFCFSSVSVGELNIVPQH